MDFTMETLLDPRVLTERYIQQYNAGDYPITKDFWTNVGTNEGDIFRYPFKSAMTTPAPLNVRGGTARQLTPLGIEERFGKCFHVFNELPVDGDALTALRNLDSNDLQEKGIESLQIAFDDFGSQHAIQKELILTKALTSGVVYVDGQGRVLESSSGAVMTADYGVAATHTGNLNSIISALWDVASTKISTQLDNIKRAARKANVPIPTEIYVNEINKIGLRGNTEFNDWAKYANLGAVETILRGDMIPNLWGFNWHFVGGTYTASDGSTKDLFPTTIAVICPAPNGPWIRRTSGSTLVPNGVGLATDWRSAVNQLQKKYGPYSYAAVQHNPPKIALFVGDVFGFIFTDPNAIWIATAFSATA